MAERKETAYNRVVMKPPAYLRRFDFNPKRWGDPHPTRRAELNHYERGREIGATERDPELEDRLMKRRQRQQQYAERRARTDAQEPQP